MSGKPTDRILARVARHQHGLITLAQAVEHGVTEAELRARLARGSLRRAAPRVFAVAGSQHTWQQQVLAACLSAGPAALASHRSAAVLWDLIDAPAAIELVVPDSSSPQPPGAIIHRVRDLRASDAARRQRIPVTNPIRTVVDLGGTAPDLVPTAVERGLYRNVFSVAALRRFVDERGGRGRRGTGVLRRTLDQRALADLRTCSPLESMFATIAADAGLRLEYQHVVITEGRRYVLDFALPEVMVGVEVDGLEVHATRHALDHDLERQNRLVRAGWLLLRYSRTHMRSRRQAIRRELVEVIAQRRGGQVPA
jgi:very-short-patch-repair endonuclease